MSERPTSKTGSVIMERWTLGAGACHEIFVGSGVSKKKIATFYDAHEDGPTSFCRARLASAAPFLLEELRSIRDGIHENNCSHESFGNGCDRRCINATAAIAKAEGYQP